MKTVHVTAGSESNPVTNTVQLNGHDESEILTAKMAKSAARIGFGHTDGVTASDGKTCYRMTKSGCRKVELEPDYD
jgi:hypothetical protein